MMRVDGNCASECSRIEVQIPVQPGSDGSLLADFGGLLDTALSPHDGSDRKGTLYVTASVIGDYNGALSSLRFATEAYNVLVHAESPQVNLVVVHPQCSAAAHAAAECRTANIVHGKAAVAAVAVTRSPTSARPGSDTISSEGQVLGAADAPTPGRYIRQVGIQGYPFGDPSGQDIYERYDVVVVGGTFDRLHAGHRLLLTAAAWASRRKLWIGVTSAELLTHKSHADLIAPFLDRADAARQFSKRVRPDLTEIHIAELHDPAGPASNDPTVNAMVVSRETLASADAINNARRTSGLSTMVIITVDVLSGGSTKLSSSTLRQADAARLSQ